MFKLIFTKTCVTQDKAKKQYTHTLPEGQVLLADCYLKSDTLFSQDLQQDMDNYETNKDKLHFPFVQNWSILIVPCDYRKTKGWRQESLLIGEYVCVNINLCDFPREVDTSESFILYMLTIITLSSSYETIKANFQNALIRHHFPLGHQCLLIDRAMYVL